MSTYIVATYCPKCDKYSKGPSHGCCDPCSDCDSKQQLEMVEKWGEHDPNIREKVINVCYGENPRYSVTMGVTENQIEQAHKLHPEADWKKFGTSYRPLIKNRADKLRMMRQCGMSEFPPDMFKGREQ